VVIEAHYLQQDRQPGHDPEHVAMLRTFGDDLLKGPKWHAALGAFNGAERGEVLDMLGFQRQVVFSSFCAGKLFGDPDHEVRIAGCAAHNRSMAEFCAADPRLIGVGLATLDEPTDTLALIDEARTLGLGALWIPASAPGGRSPGHADHDPVWARLADIGMPFILHVGSSPLMIANEWMNDGHSERLSARGRAEVIGSKDLMVIYHPIERFLATLILDGVLERFPTLTGAAVEVGAGWVPQMCRRLDHAVDIWARSEPHLAEMKRKPSEQIDVQLRFTPYPFEDVGALVDESSPNLFMFSSDYPHAEGGRDPLGRMRRSLAGHNDATRARFLFDNFNSLLPEPRVTR
jgi:predicted TIM-barrel fold metal-dependent hydrolase